MSTFSLAAILVLVMLFIGPRQLPHSLEEIWLALTNFNRSQHALEPLTMDVARLQWERMHSPFYSLIGILYGAAEHLEELRKRLILTLIVFAIFTAIGAVFQHSLLEILMQPAGNVRMIATQPQEAFLEAMKVSFTFGLIVALPVGIYELLLFIGPAFESEDEQRMFQRLKVLMFPMVLIFFFGGVLFGYYLLLPPGYQYLFGFNQDIINQMPRISDYMSLTLTLLMWMGITFELPVFIFLLARFHIVTWQQLAARWREAVVIITIVAAVITPTWDPISMLIVAAPLVVLYFAGLLLARLGT